MTDLRTLLLALPFLLLAACAGPTGVKLPEGPWVVNEPEAEMANGKLIVFVTGDEEYRSEEGMPQLARILAERHGFRCLTLFSIDQGSGDIAPDVNNNIPGLSLLDHADLVVLFTRFRDLPDEQMVHLAGYLESGRPLVALRTATHAFKLRADSPWADAYNWNSQAEGLAGGFGRRVLGETWIAHHGQHGVQGTRGIIDVGALAHPVIRGVADGAIFGTTDVYRVRLPMPEGFRTLVAGEVTESLDPTSAAVEGEVNDPLMPVAWVRQNSRGEGRPSRVFTTTMGAATDLTNESLRRLLVNACYWTLGLEVPANADVALVGDYEPTAFGFGGAKQGVKPADLAWPVSDG